MLLEATKIESWMLYARKYAVQSFFKENAVC